jgi:hypothetical protein
MSKNNKFLPVLVYSALTMICVFALPKTASANFPPAADSLGLINAACPTQLEAYRELNRLKTEIMAAATVNQAREIALAPTDGAMNALENASILMPSSDDLLTAKNRLSEVRARMFAASSRKQVADELSGLMLAGLDDNAANVSVGKESCHYTTGEVIAIVIGLILGIIPGLILLVLLC